MTFIDWSDSEEMVGLLIEYIADERSGSPDPKRRHFLNDLLKDLSALNEQSAHASTKALEQLRSIYQSIDPEFQQDDVTSHIKDCIEELERLKNQGVNNSKGSRVSHVDTYRHK